MLVKVPDKNTVFFVWLNNYAGLLLKTPSKTLLIDPVEIKPRNFPQVDAILISHEHYDHLDQRLVAELQKVTSCLVFADSTSYCSLKNSLPSEKLREIQVGEQTKIGEVTIKAEKAKHPAATPLTFIITSEDGVKIWHTSDSAPYPEMATIAQKEQLDVVFCTVGIAPGASAETGFEIAWLTKPKVAVPYHSNSVVNQKKFAEMLKRELPKTTCLIPEIEKIYQVSKGEKKTW
ncbi:MAG: MBL fold metallo-hydrolase [Candidatus Bathyarchaeota archaeon]|nr:MBL fold metallo-hydrolase [Candidatus Bathyarchaeota archaeon]